MKRILTVVGARPQIIKSAALSRAVRALAAGEVEERLLHTGQHYDAAMSEVFFGELGLPRPDYQLGVGSGSHGRQTARMIEGIEAVLEAEAFDGVVLYGDTNSTLAGAVAAAKRQVPVFHIEAGLRSFNMAMPEEQNRIVCDHLASICFAPTAAALDNLRREGLADSPARFPGGKPRRAMLSGDVMYDNSLHFASLSAARPSLLSSLGLEREGYALATVHRDFNTDQPQRLDAILRALEALADGGLPVVLPLHPRTAARMGDDRRRSLEAHRDIHLLPPASFLEMIELERHARMVLTDSGGVQKEAFFFRRPCVILRPETEWVEIVGHGAAQLADADTGRILAAAEALDGRQASFPPLYGDGHAAEHILRAILEH